MVRGSRTGFEGVLGTRGSASGPPRGPRGHGAEEGRRRHPISIDRGTRHRIPVSPPGRVGRVGDRLKGAAVRQFDAVRHGACQRARPDHSSCARCVRAAESKRTVQRPAGRGNPTDEQRKRWARPRRDRGAREEHESSKGNGRAIPPRLGRAKAARANSASATPGSRRRIEGAWSRGLGQPRLQARPWPGQGPDRETDAFGRGATRPPPTCDSGRATPALTASAPPLEAAAASKGLGIGVWSSVCRFARARTSPSRLSHAGQQVGPRRPGAHARITRATTSLHHRSIKPVAGERGRKGSVAWTPPRCPVVTRALARSSTHAVPPKGQGATEHLPPKELRRFYSPATRNR